MVLIMLLIFSLLSSGINIMIKMLLIVLIVVVNGMDGVRGLVVIDIKLLIVLFSVIVRLILL